MMADACWAWAGCSPRTNRVSPGASSAREHEAAQGTNTLVAIELEPEDGRRQSQDFQHAKRAGKWAGCDVMRGPAFSSSRERVRGAVGTNPGQIPEKEVADRAPRSVRRGDPPDGRATRIAASLQARTRSTDLDSFAVESRAYGVRNDLTLFSNFTPLARDL